MNRKQLISIQCLTTQMQSAAPYSSRASLVFTVVPERDGFIVEGLTHAESMHWTDTDFHTMAFVGPRGGVKHYRVLSA